MALTDNLVAYYKLDGNANDSAGSNHGTATNVSYVAGKISQAGSFNGSSSAIVIPNTLLNYNWNTAYSIQVWMKTTNSTNTLALLANSLPSWPYTGFDFSINYGFPTDKQLYVNINAAGVERSNGCAVPSYLYNGTWNQIVLTQDNNGNNNIYINGVNQALIQISSGNPTPNYTGRTNTIGARDNAVSYMNGSIDEVGIWSRALSAGEVSQLYNSGAGITYPFLSNPSNSIFNFSN